MKDLSEHRDLNKMVDKTMAFLDEDFQVPETLVDRILSNRPKQTSKTSLRKLNFSLIAQVAAVLLMGVFLGVVLGKNANSNVLLSKETKKNRCMMDYKASHHLTVDYSQSVFLYNAKKAK